MMRGEVTVLQLLLVVSLIRQTRHQSRRRMIDLAAPAQQRQEDGPGPVREGLEQKKKKKMGEEYNTWLSSFM